MTNTTKLNISHIDALKAGAIIAYPTEAVFGLGCDPLNQHAVKKLLALKQRDINKGLILIAADFSQFEKFVLPLPEDLLEKIFKTWPGPTTWAFPASKQAPSWITGQHNSIAIRVTNHSLAREICQQFDGAIVSTSANIEGEMPAKTAEMVKKYFADQAIIIAGELGGRSLPSTIIDALSGKVLR